MYVSAAGRVFVVWCWLLILCLWAGEQAVEVDEAIAVSAEAAAKEHKAQLELQKEFNALMQGVSALRDKEADVKHTIEKLDDSIAVLRGNVKHVRSCRYSVFVFACVDSHLGVRLFISPSAHKATGDGCRGIPGDVVCGRAGDCHPVCCRCWRRRGGSGGGGGARGRRCRGIQG